MWHIITPAARDLWSIHFGQGLIVYQIFRPHSISKEFGLWLTPVYLWTSFDSNNFLHFGQVFFLPNLVTLGHSYCDLLLIQTNSYMTYDPSNALRSGQGFLQANLVTIGNLKRKLLNQIFRLPRLGKYRVKLDRCLFLKSIFEIFRNKLA